MSLRLIFLTRFNGIRGKVKMITCKEDLMNTHVDNVNGKLKALFLNKCKEFGVDYFENFINNAKYIEVYSAGWLYTNRPENGRQLTIADFKPAKKMNVEYVIVKDSIFDLRDDFNGRLLYWWYESDCKDKSEYVRIISEYDLTTYASSDNLYRRVETEVTWQDNAEELLELHSVSDDSDFYWYIKNDPEFVIKLSHLVASMTDKPE